MSDKTRESGWTSFDKQTRQQAISTCYALEDMRDRAITQAGKVEAALARVEPILSGKVHPGYSLDFEELATWADEEERPIFARWLREVAKASAALTPQPASPAADGEHVHVCVTCKGTWDGEKWVTA